MIGVITNTISIILGSSIGLAAKKAIPDSWNDIILKGMGLICIYIGVSGMLDGEKTLVLVLSMVAGAMLGQAADLDGRFNRLAQRVENHFKKKGGESSFAQGFVTATLIFCVGAMSIVGPMDAALKGDNSILFTKTVMDGITSMMLSASMGIGVLCASVLVLLFQGGIYLLAAAIQPFLTASVIAEMTCAGSLLIVALGLNLTGATNLKVMNYAPAIFLPIAFCPLYDWICTLM